MKHAAIILAGGVGRRMGGAMPKQFLSMDDKPIIIHTLEHFQRHESIDAILVVCVEDWMAHLKEILDEYKISKVKWIVAGGKTAHDSTRNGVFFLRDKLADDDQVVIHDANRPILPQAAIDDMLRVSHEKGNASLAIPCYETVLFSNDGKSGDRELDRTSIMRVQTPQAYNYKFVRELYEQAERDGMHDFVYADLVAIHYGRRIYFSRGFTSNIKITRKEDIPLCKSLMKCREEDLFNL